VATVHDVSLMSVFAVMVMAISNTFDSRRLMICHRNSSMIKMINAQTSARTFDAD
jgi:hypothetical protein